MEPIAGLDQNHAEWVELLRGVVDVQRRLLAGVPNSEARAKVVGQGAGGDATLEIDAAAERALLDALEHAPHPVAVITEEAGVLGSAESVLLVDPLDGSNNAQRLYPAYAFSAALAQGPLVRDIELGYVFDLATGQEFVAQRGAGAWCDGTPLSISGKRAEVVAFESVEYDPNELAATITAMAQQLGAFRTRVIGSTAMALCYCAAGRVDAVVSSGRCRLIDFAAAQLIARESGLAVGLQSGQIDQTRFGLERVHQIHASANSEVLRQIVKAVAEAASAPIGSA